MRWRRTTEELDRLSSSKKFGLVPVESIRGFVHAIPNDTYLSNGHETSSRRYSDRNLNQMEAGWEAEQFYINRLQRQKQYQFIVRAF